MKLKGCFFVLFSMSNIIFSYNVHQLQTIQLNMQSKKTPVQAAHFDLRGLGFLLKGANFSGAQLSGTLFDAISANPDTQFSGLIEIPNQSSDLSGTNFKNASLISTSFKNTTLHKADFSGADISYADFSGADLTGAKLSKALHADLALFTNAKIS